LFQTAAKIFVSFLILTVSWVHTHEEYSPVD
jgi:hypothetical protein